MRVLHVYGGTLFGGIETVLVTIARQHALCPSMTHEFALSGEGPVGRALAAAGATVHPLPASRASRPLSVWRARRVLARLLRTGRFDRVICHAVWPYAMFGSVVRQAGVPLVIWAHDAMTGAHWTERWARRTVPDLAICNSRYTAGTLPHVFPSARSTVLFYPHEMPPGALSPEGRARVRAELETPDSAVVIVQAGRLEPYKGWAALIAALGTLGDVPGWILWLIGAAQRPFEQEYLESLRSSPQQLGIADRVRFGGHRSDMPRVFASADIQCQPNARPEPFGLVFVEALAAGLPVVGSQSGGVLEIVDDTCGVLVPPGDAAALARALRELITDPARRHALALAAPARARRLCDPSTQLHALHDALVAVHMQGDAA